MLDVSVEERLAGLYDVSRLAINLVTQLFLLLTFFGLSSTRHVVSDQYGDANAVCASLCSLSLYPGK